MVHTCNAGTWKAETGRSLLSLRPTRLTQCDLVQKEKGEKEKGKEGKKEKKRTGGLNAINEHKGQLIFVPYSFIFCLFQGLEQDLTVYLRLVWGLVQFGNQYVNQIQTCIFLTAS